MWNMPIPGNDQVDLVSSDDDATDMEADGGPFGQNQTSNALNSQLADGKPSEGTWYAFNLYL